MKDEASLFPLTDKRDGIRVNQHVIFIDHTFGCYGFLGEVKAIDADPRMPHPYLVEVLKPYYDGFMYCDRGDIDSLAASSYTISLLLFSCLVRIA